MLLDFALHLTDARRLSANTREAYCRDVRQFLAYLKEAGLEDAAEAGQAHIAGYLAHQGQAAKAASTVSRQLAALRSFYGFLVGTNHLAGDPTQSLTRPKLDKRAPRVLAKPEVDKLFEAPNTDTHTGLRDRAMLEALYATGLKASEIIALGLSDISITGGYLRCTGARERVVPLGRSACLWLERYVADSRPHLVRSAGEGFLFVNHHGDPLTRQGFWKIVKKRAKEAGIGAEINPDALRHSFAAHLVAGGADLKSVQEMLGYASISSTLVYAEMGRRRLAEVYSASHPRA